MRVFDHFPQDVKVKCPICKTDVDKPCVLVAVAGTGKGFNYVAEPFHLDCIELFYFKDGKIIAQVF